MISQVFHLPQEGEGSLPFILDCAPLTSGSSKSCYSFVSAGEDGSVNIWEGDIVHMKAVDNFAHCCICY